MVSSWYICIVKQVLMPIEEDILLVLLHSWDEISNYCLIILVVHAEHRVVHRACLPNDIWVILVPDGGPVQPAHHFVTVFFESLIILVFTSISVDFL